MATIAKLLISLGLDASDVDKGAGQAESRMKKLGSGMTSVGKGLTAGVTLPIAAMGLASIDAASDLEESMNKANVVFGDSAKIISDFSKTANTSIGTTQAEALEAAGTFGNLFVSMGLGQEEAANMSKSLLTLGADLGSFNNLEPTIALDKLRAGLVGETEPLRALGVNMTAAKVKAKAMEMGLADAGGELSDAALVTARYALIMEQTAVAQGDFANTSDGLANSQRIVKAQIGDLMASMGQELLPIVLQVVTAVKGLLDTFLSLPPGTRKMIVMFAAVAAAIGPLLIIVGQVIGAVSAIGGAIGAVSGIVSGGVAVITGALATVAAPVLIIIAVVAALALAWKTNFLGIQEKTAAVINWLKEFIPEALEFLKGVFSAAFEFISAVVTGNWSKVGEMTSGAVESVKEKVSSGLESARSTVASKFDSIRSKISETWGSVKERTRSALVNIVADVTGNHDQAESIVSGAWDKIKGFISNALQFIAGLIRTQFEVMKGIITVAFEAIKTVVMVAWELIKAAVILGVNTIKTVIVAALQAISGDWKGAWETMKSGLIQNLFSMDSSARSIIGILKSNVLNILGSLAGGVFEKGAAMARRFGEGISSALNSALDHARGLAAQIRSFLPSSDAERGPLSDLFASGQALPDTIGKGISSGAPGLLREVEGLAEGVRNTIGVGFETGPGLPDIGGLGGQNSIGLGFATGSDITGAFGAIGQEAGAAVGEAVEPMIDAASACHCVGKTAAAVGRSVGKAVEKPIEAQTKELRNSFDMGLGGFTTGPGLPDFGGLGGQNTGSPMPDLSPAPPELAPLAALGPQNQLGPQDFNRSGGGAVGGLGQVNININNPEPQPAPGDVVRGLRGLQYLGVEDPLRGG